MRLLFTIGFVPHSISVPMKSEKTGLYHVSIVYCTISSNTINVLSTADKVTNVPRMQWIYKPKTVLFKKKLAHCYDVIPFFLQSKIIPVTVRY